MSASAIGYFEDTSMLRKVQRERAVALSGQRALLMQAAHPLAVFGLLAHTSALDEPYQRLARTAETMNTITFGSRSDRLLCGGHDLPSRRSRAAAVGAVHARRLRARRLQPLRPLALARRGSGLLGGLQARGPAVRPQAGRHA